MARRSIALRGFLTVDDVARDLGRSRFAVYRRVRQGELGGVVRIGRSILFDPDGYAAWKRNGGSPEASPRQAAR